jgi:hypothetical protein
MLKLPKFKKKLNLRKVCKIFFETKVKRIVFETMKNCRKKMNRKFLIYSLLRILLAQSLF